MTLGQFVKTTQNTFTEKFQARAAATGQRPLLVFVREYKEGLTTEHAKDGTGKGVVLDVLDLGLYASNPGHPDSVYCNVLWMGGAVRDQLRPYVGQEAPLPIKLAWTTPAGGGTQYIVPEALEGDWLTYAQQIYDADRQFVDKVKAAKKAKWEQDNPAPVPGMGALAPAQAPVAAPVMQAPVAAPPVQQQAPVIPPAPVAAPQAPAQAPVAPPQAPVTAPAMQAPGAPPQAPVAPPQAPGQVGDQDVQALLDQLNA